MNRPDFRPLPLIGTVILATLFWFVTFYLTWSSFWIKISFSAATLAILSLLLQPDHKERIRIDAKAIALGLVSAAVLYFIFWTGKAVSALILPFAGGQIGGIYDKGAGTPMWTIALLLFFVTGPSEELYWRGYLQKNLMMRFGQWQGWLLATAIYAAVHIWSFNFMLIGAAAVAGAFWGAMYWRLKNLAPVIISHSVWSAVIFAVFPMGQLS
ncbi:MAG: CPBP family intramembrane metalloprotease [Proteobacteria bacterium]|nr:CPBP family intramembrane metalloprotease [Pseudomonadota bacterium]